MEIRLINSVISERSPGKSKTFKDESVNITYGKLNGLHLAIFVQHTRNYACPLINLYNLFVIFLYCYFLCSVRIFKHYLSS
ncbi:hypothetical protein E2C01_056739 [Portunus trituberculatus]|uniref:Uncharacterized protein n=1 Tax=Portunus trituberculatus TaxID=210409 RepID=A0A5B7GRM6_PORTR|nr:hypothetical protein [Portunus trituberculatus]